MNHKAFYNRYKEVRDTHLGKVSNWKKFLYILDYLLSFVFDGASFSDYFAYKFYNLRRSGRNEYITYKRHRTIQNICNPDKEAIAICRDKIKFNNFFSGFLGRKWLDVNTVSFKEFQDFLSSVGDMVFVKAIDGYCGIGVEAYPIKDIDPEALYKKLKGNCETRYILEEKITQGGEIAEFHSNSINTIRLVTIYDPKKNVVNIMSSSVRFGRGGDPRDNLHVGGIAVHIDVDTGILCTPGFNKKDESFLVHPDSGKQFIGFKIPYWEECKEFVRRMARKLPDVRYIGWDVVSKGDGTFVLIEANDNADHDIQQIHYRGCWEDYKKILHIK